MYILITFRFSFKSCLSELKEQSDSDGNFIGSTFESLRDLYSKSYPQFFDKEDAEYEAPTLNEGLNQNQDEEKKLEKMKLFLSGKSTTL